MMHLVRTDRGKWQRHQNQLQPRLCDLLSDNRNTNSERDNPKSISELTSIRNFER